jgi:hypothetical protein
VTLYDRRKPATLDPADSQAAISYAPSYSALPNLLKLATVLIFWAQNSGIQSWLVVIDFAIACETVCIRRQRAEIRKAVRAAIARQDRTSEAAPA